MNTNFHTKKHLGQHLLIDKNVIKKIISFANDINNLNIIEIGPGTGNLTKELLIYAKHLTAIEKDEKTIPFLTEIKSKNNKFDFLINDALKVNLLKLEPTPDAIIANLPYNIGTLLFTNWLNISQFFKYFILMFQKEVALRITANVDNKNYGRLSLFTNIYGTAELLFCVDKLSFKPSPKVDSAVIKFIPYKIPIQTNIKLFEQITKTAFNSKRKMLRQSLKVFNFDFKSINVNPESRAENLSLDKYLALTKQLEIKMNL